jgi:prepilin-type N-terminal cleavage/methylation domain-containing protein
MNTLYTKNKTTSSSRGFTIIETLVAIFVLLIVTTGPLAFAQSGLRASFLARDQITAFYLAQEAIEIIKNARDSNRFSVDFDTDWLDGSSVGDCDPGDNAGDSAICNIHVPGGPIIEVEPCASKCSPLRYDDTTKQFVISGGNSNSKYTRTVYLDMITDYELQIIVEVSWESNLLSAPKRIIVQENIFKR